MRIKKKYSWQGWIVRFIWAGFAFVILVPVLLVAAVANGLLGPLPDATQLENPETALATTVYSADGVLLGKYYATNRTRIDYQDLNENVVNALVATEDIRFYNHAGVDIQALFRVGIKTVFMGDRSSGGGSTITQQLAKNLFPRNKLNKAEFVIRKLKEWVIAARLEKLYTKDEIIAMYLNTVDFGSNATGIKSAAATFFNVDPGQLSVTQAATLVGMLKATTAYNPHLNPESSKGRRNVVLSQMNRYGYLSDQRFGTLVKQPIELEYRVETHNEGLATYFREHLRLWLQKWANENGYDIYEDGLQVHTTLDSRLQRYGEIALKAHLDSIQRIFYRQYSSKDPWAANPEIIDLTVKRSERYRALKAANLTAEQIVKSFNTKRKMKVYTLRGERDTTLSPLDSIKHYKSVLRGGFLAMEPHTGAIKAWVGGQDYKFLQYDHITSARQVGSTFKPFVYATAIDNNFTPCTRVPNVPQVWEEYDNWSPQNSDGEYGDLLTLQQALAKSVNCVTARVMKDVGILPVIQMARNMGIKSRLEKVPSLCLGVAEIPLYEMVPAFNTFNSDGIYTAPYYVTHITDKTGRTIVQYAPETREVLDPKKNYIMLHMLQQVTQPSMYGTASRLRYRYGFDIDMAGKTGTTQNNSDAWFMGLIPQLTGGVWVGAEDRAVHFASTVYGQGAAAALPVWARFLQLSYADKSAPIDRKAKWKKPEGELPASLNCKDEDFGLPDLDYPDINDL